MKNQFPGVDVSFTPWYYVALLVFALLSYWVYHDAKTRGSEWAWQWGIGTFVLLSLGVIPGIALLGVYLLKRGNIGSGVISYA